MFPEKSFYKFTEVVEFLDIKPYLIRFWESEFVQVSSITSENGQRVYPYTSFKLLKKIKDLLIVQKLSLENAKHIIDLETLPVHHQAEEIKNFVPLVQNIEVNNLQPAIESTPIVSTEINPEKLKIRLKKDEVKAKCQELKIILAAQMSQIKQMQKSLGIQFQ